MDGLCVTFLEQAVLPFSRFSLVLLRLDASPTLTTDLTSVSFAPLSILSTEREYLFIRCVLMIRF